MIKDDKNTAVEDNEVEQNADVQDTELNDINVDKDEEKGTNNNLENSGNVNSEEDENKEDESDKKDGKKNKVFTQEEVNNIVKERLKRDRENKENEMSELENRLNTLQTSLKTEKITNELIKHNVREDRIDTIMKLGDFDNIDLDNIGNEVNKVVEEYPEFVNIPKPDLGDESNPGVKISTEGSSGTKTPEEKELEKIRKMFNL